MRNASALALNLPKVLTFGVSTSVFLNQFNFTEASSVVVQKPEGPDEKRPQPVICLARDGAAAKGSLRAIALPVVRKFPPQLARG